MSEEVFDFSGYLNLWVKETPDSVATWALSQPRNEFHFVETQVYPPKGAYIMVDEKGTKHKWEVELSPFTPFKDTEDILRMGFEWYNAEVDKSNGRVPCLSKEKWEQQHRTIYNKIDKEIERHHGVQCFLNGRSDLEDPKMNVVLHFCDVLVIAMRQMKGQNPPQVLIKSTNLETISTSTTFKLFPSDPLLPEGLTSEEHFFVFLNADIFYHMYGLWSNNSNKPIRLENKDIVGLERSTEFSNHPTFIGHQKGKYNKLKRCCHNEVAKYLYITH